MRSPKILAAILVGAPVTFLLTAHSSLSEPAAEECKSKPGSSTPRGSHWYYRINRVAGISAAPTRAWPHTWRHRLLRHGRRRKRALLKRQARRRGKHLERQRPRQQRRCRLRLTTPHCGSLRSAASETSRILPRGGPIFRPHRIWSSPSFRG